MTDQDAANIWAIPVDPDTGQGRGEPRQLTDWDAMGATSFRGSALAYTILPSLNQTRSVVSVTPGT